MTNEEREKLFRKLKPCLQTLYVTATCDNVESIEFYRFIMKTGNK